MSQRPMSQYDERDERHLRAGLHQRVEGLQGATLGAEDVKRRAVAIRRSRRLTVATGILGVAAIIVPVAALLQPDAGGSNPAAPAEQPSATGEQTTEPTRAGESVTPAPGPSGLAIPYLEDSRITFPDGSTRTLPQNFDGVAVVGELVYAIDSRNGASRRLSVLDADDEEVSGFDIAGGLAVHADRTSIAWAEPDGSIWVGTATTQMFVADAGQAVAPAALVGDQTCSDGCLVYLNSEGVDPAPLLAYSDGTVERVTGNGLSVSSVNAQGHVAMQVSSSRAGSCSAVVDESTDEALFETCDFSFDEFAPDGMHLSATDAYRDGIGASYVSVLDARDGAEVATYNPAGDGFLRNYEWEDSEHLLVEQYVYGEGWSVVRLGLDGTTETVLGPSTAGDDLDPVYVLL